MPKSEKIEIQAHENDEYTPDLEYMGSPEEGVHRSIASRQKLRDKMSGDVEAFLAQGGSINEVEPNVMADPPRKPQSNYGSRPI
ncbi:hypothetical protein [Bermanella marisrubri]|uniref:Transcriptional regulator SutA RNAP-binding domain-containing protein n=1 Tax=Bermanella marisrubri TaxID=207949 RepID=Q1MZ19_9GAMM|nr:hypothetical protein [Bermanella marisrubri]EAT11209.1 hypothetical protein RED65_07269 [Oceanobacter sp. RED65] [Bermanella marisrubri]